MFEIVSGRVIGGEEPCFVIAECGQNHNGNIDLAMNLISSAKHTVKADCVKFQKSHLESKFNAKALERPYVSPHSWGNTYGEHKHHLEFTNEQFLYLKRFAQNEGIAFTASAMDSKSLEFLIQMDVPFIKIGSGDVNNYPLIETAAKCNKPLVVSTGMHDLDVVHSIYDMITPKNSRLCLMHCLSAYPAPSADINLKVITNYKNAFPKCVIGYSGHELGTAISIAAVTLGAKVLERHFTLDNTMKGTDHSASLEPIHFQQLISQIRDVELALSGSGIKIRQNSELSCYRKLGKSIVSKQFIARGTALSLEMIDIKVAEPFGIEAHNVFRLIGKVVKKDIEFDESIQYEHLF